MSQQNEAILHWKPAPNKASLKITEKGSFPGNVKNILLRISQHTTLRKIILPQHLSSPLRKTFDFCMLCRNNKILNSTCSCTSKPPNTFVLEHERMASFAAAAAPVPARTHIRAEKRHENEPLCPLSKRAREVCVCSLKAMSFGVFEAFEDSKGRPCWQSP